MFKKTILNIISIIIIFLAHQVITALDWRLNLWPVIIAYGLMIWGAHKTLLWALTAGFLLDIFSPLPFGLHLITMYLITIILYLLVKNFLTNRSFLSFFSLAILSPLLYEFILYGGEKILITLNATEKIIILNPTVFLIKILSNLLLMLILFFITLKFTKRLSTSIIN